MNVALGFSLGLIPSPSTSTPGRKGSVPPLSFTFSQNSTQWQCRRRKQVPDRVEEEMELMPCWLSVREKPGSRWWDRQRGVEWAGDDTDFMVQHWLPYQDQDTGRSVLLLNNCLFTPLAREKGPFPVYDCWRPGRRGDLAPVFIAGLLERLSLSPPKWSIHSSNRYLLSVFHVSEGQVSKTGLIPIWGSSVRYNLPSSPCLSDNRAHHWLRTPDVTRKSWSARAGI